MIDFSLRTEDQRVGALNMGLCPGVYAGKESRPSTLYVAESAFGFLEPSIRRHSPEYARGYSHWGVTEILRAEWQNIIQDWERLRSNIAAARTVQDVGRFCVMPKELEDEFKETFEVNKTGFLNLIDQLIDWLRTKLSTHGQVSVIGIQGWRGDPISRVVCEKWAYHHRPIKQSRGPHLHPTSSVQ